MPSARRLTARCGDGRGGPRLASEVLEALVPFAAGDDEERRSA
jgi:hypothetical protein